MGSKLRLTTNINEEELDKNNYYSSLINNALLNGYISEDNYNFIKLQELELINLKIKSFTGESTTSIGIARASSLNENNNFIISYYLKSLDNPDQALEELLNNTLVVLVKKGEELLNKDLIKERMFYNIVESNMLDIVNIAYQETFKDAVKRALKYYNYSYEAHDKIIVGDYPTSIYPSSLGLEFLIEYMNNFNYENLFLQHYDVKLINDMLYRISKDSPNLIFNVYEYAITYSILSSIIDYDIYNLYIDNVGKELIYLNLIDKNENEIKDIIFTHAKRVIKEFDLSNKTSNYVLKTLNKIEIQIISSIYNDSLDNLIP